MIILLLDRDHLTQTEIMNRLLSYNEELKQGYEIYQSFLSVLQYHEQEEKQQEATEGFQSLLMPKLQAPTLKLSNND